MSCLALRRRSWSDAFLQRRSSNRATCVLLIGLLLYLAGCAAQSPPVQPSDQSTAGAVATSRADDLLVVDCLLPGQIRKLGRMTYLTPRRPLKTTAQDCEIRGGEYVAYDRSDYATALKVWLPQAQEGDKEAQTYVGEIYEKGLGVQPDYAVAAAWYRKAAEQGHSRAQINLGHLYEKGLGVEQDAAKALAWYRKASGLSEAAIALDTGTIPWEASASEVQQELQTLRQEVERWRREAADLRQQLDQTQQQLEQTQQELERRQRGLETERRRLQQTRQELQRRKQQLDAATARDDAESRRLEAQLEQRIAELERQRQEMARLQQEKARLEDETKRHRAQLARLEQQQQQVALAGPTIEMIDPPVTETRGLSVVNVSSDIIGQQREIIGRVTSPAGLLSLMVNDRQERIDDKGLFRLSIPIRGNRVPVQVVAIDKQGKRASVEFQLSTNTVAASIAPRPEALPNLQLGTYYALVIGNQTYTHWPSLKTPEHDAASMANLLGKKYGFKTNVLLNATRFDILQALNELRKNLTEKDNLLIYYAGHGYWEEKIQRGYWVPVDGHLDSNVNWISTFAITDILSTMSARHILVIADSCYSGALTRSALARLEAGMSDAARRHWLKALAAKRSRTVLSSGALEPVLDSGGGQHSVFAKAFIDVLDANDEILVGQQLYSQVSARVAYAADALAVDQNPQYAPIRYAGHEAGDFILIPMTLQ